MKLERRFLAIPYFICLLVFVVLPLLVVIYYAFTGPEGQPTFGNFLSFFANPRTVGTLFYSVFVALLTTVVCLVLAYPTAYILARGAFAGKSGLLLLVVMPMWINFTLRLTALKEVLDLLEGNLAMHPLLNTVIGQTYDFLPFMILPIYNSMTRMDGSLLEAAEDLGAGKLSVFWKVMIPLSMPGIISGVTMVFLPSMTNYVVLDMLYNSTFIVGSLIGSYFAAYDWHNGSMIATILLILMVLIGLVTDKATGGDVEERSTVL